MWWRLVALAALLATLVGCGSGVGAGITTTTERMPTTTTSTPAAAPAGPSAIAALRAIANPPAQVERAP